MYYRLFGWWFRWQACKMAALVMSERQEDADEGMCPRLWSITVFFELYMTLGADGTVEEFGPKEPVDLQEVRG